MKYLCLLYYDTDAFAHAVPARPATANFGGRLGVGVDVRARDAFESTPS